MDPHDIAAFWAGDDIANSEFVSDAYVNTGSSDAYVKTGSSDAYVKTGSSEAYV